MRPASVVIDPPFLNELPGVSIAAEEMLIETLVSKYKGFETHS